MANPMLEWEAMCHKYRGRILTGKYAHFCYDWDMLPVDETTPDEFECCTCYRNEDLLLGMDSNKTGEIT
jgi:hypothetical protein